MHIAHNKCAPRLLSGLVKLKVRICQDRQAKMEMEYMQCTLHSTFTKPNTTQHNIIVRTVLSSGPMQVDLDKMRKSA